MEDGIFFFSAQKEGTLTKHPCLGRARLLVIHRTDAEAETPVL